MYVYMYVYEDSNFGGFRFPCVYVHAHKWLKHQILASIDKYRPLPIFVVLRTEFICYFFSVTFTDNMAAVAVRAICINWDQLRLKNQGFRVYYLQHQGNVSLNIKL